MQMAFVTADEYLSGATKGGASSSSGSGFVSASDFLQQKQQKIDHVAEEERRRQEQQRSSWRDTSSKALTHTGGIIGNLQDQGRLPEVIEPVVDRRSKTERILDYVFQENPVSRVINYPFAKAAEYSVPDAPMVKDGRNVPGTSAREEHARRNPVESTGNDVLDQVLGVAGQVGSYFLNPSAPAQGPAAVYNAARNIAATRPVNAITSRTPNALAKRAVTEAAQEGAAAAAYAVPHSLIQGDTSAGEIAQNVALEGGLGIATGGLLGALSDPVKKAFQAWRNRGNAPAQVGEILALPEPKPKMLREGTVAGEGVMTGPGKIEPLALPEPKVAPPTTARVERRANPYRDKFEKLIEIANRQKFTPGREYEELEELWGRLASREDPGLDELIERAYPRRREAKPEMMGAARQQQSARDQYGVPGPVKSMDERYRPYVGEAAAPAVGPVGARRASGNTASQRVPAPKKTSVASSVPRETPRQQPPSQAEEALRSSPPPDDIDYPFENVPESAYAAESADVVTRDPRMQQYFDEELGLEPETLNATPTPRIRDRMNAKADEWIQQALNDIKNPNRLSSNPIDTYAKLGAGLMMKGTVKLADFTEEMVKMLGEEIRPQVRKIFTRSKEQYQQIKTETERQELGIFDIDVSKLKNFSSLKFNSTDVYRNFRDVFGEQFPKVKAAVLDPLDDAKKQHVELQEKLLTELQEKVVKGLGIKKNSKLSALVQDYGEGVISLDQLKAKAPEKWKSVVRADQWFRATYDQLIDQINEVRKRIYPTNPDKWVPKRKDYYRHFQELSGLEGLKNLFETPSNIDPRLEGISEFMNPKSKFAGFMQRRGLGPYKKDAVGGFLNYLPSASYAINIDPQIGNFQKLAKNLAEMTVNTKNVNDFIRYLQRYAQDLAGKTGLLDRVIVEYVPGGRKTLGVLNWFNNRAKSNTIMGNIGTVIAQGANIPNGIAFAKQHSIPGAGKTLMSIFQPNNEIKQSGFIKERFADMMYRKFDTDWLALDNPLHLRRMAEWMLEAGDRVGTEFIWNSAYHKGLAEGVESPIKYADEETRRLIAGRGVGEVPLLQKQKSVQLVMPFMLEVANLWRVMKDFVKEKDFAGLALLFLGSYLFNQVSEEVRGSGVTFDPIEAMLDAADSDTVLKGIGRLAGEVLSNVPLGQAVAGSYPEFGTSIPIPLVGSIDLPTREEFFGDADPTRFGGGILLQKAYQDPFRYLIPGFGGNQIDKSSGGIEALLEGGSYTDDDELRFPIDPTLWNIIRGAAFGQYSTDEAREFFDKDRRALTEEQTRSYQRSSNPGAFYERTMDRRQRETERRKRREERNN